MALTGHSTLEEFQRDREQHAQALLQRCAIKPASRGFEIGSGEGTVAKLLSPHCASLDCNDISASFLERARKTCAGCPNVSFHQIQSDYLDYLPSNSYDFGFALHVFIHFNPYDMFNYLESVRRILKPGGKFYFDACSLGEQTRNLFREHAAVYRRTPQNVRGLLSFSDERLIKSIAAAADLKVCDVAASRRLGWIRSRREKPSGWLEMLVENPR